MISRLASLPFDVSTLLLSHVLQGVITDDDLATLSVLLTFSTVGLTFYRNRCWFSFADILSYIFTIERAAIACQVSGIAMCFIWILKEACETLDRTINKKEVADKISFVKQWTTITYLGKGLVIKTLLVVVVGYFIPCEPRVFRSLFVAMASLSIKVFLRRRSIMSTISGLTRYTAGASSVIEPEPENYKELFYLCATTFWLFGVAFAPNSLPELRWWICLIGWGLVESHATVEEVLEQMKKRIVQIEKQRQALKDFLTTLIDIFESCEAERRSNT